MLSIAYVNDLPTCVTKCKNFITISKNIKKYPEVSFGTIEADRYYRPIFDLLNINRYTNFHRYFGVLIYSTICA